MKRWLLLVSMVAVLLVGVPMSTAQVNPPPFIDPVLQDLSQRVGTSVQLDDLESIDWREQGFTDSSLGCPQPGQMYLQVALRGYRILLGYQGKTYDYRVARGSGLVLCSITDGIVTLEPIPTEEVAEGERISYQDISFILDPALGVSDVTSETIPAIEQDDNHPFAMPEHILFTFAGLSGDEPRLPPSIIVFSVSEYEAITGESAVEAVNLLRILLDNRPNLSEQTTLPHLPLTNIPLQTFPMQAEYIDFDGGAGIRYLEAWTHELSYRFEGLTNDSQSYIAAQFPISTDAQIEDRPDGTVIEEQVNAFEPDDFAPSLSLLDALFRSLSIGETVSWEEAQALILSGQVQQVVQLHSLEVRLTLKDGRQVKTTEPNIDDVLNLINQCGDNCAGIAVASE